MSNTNQILFPLCFTFLFLNACQHPKSNHAVTIATPAENSTEILLNMDSLFLQEPLDTLLIKYDFAVQKKNKRYQGVYTKGMFSKLISKYQLDTSHYEIVFLCKDGYGAIVPLQLLLTDKGFIAHKDLDAKLRWEANINDAFSPYYLAWNIDQDDHKHGFPYGITQIKIVNKQSEFAAAIPKNATAEVEQGFALFKQKCIKCHSVNLAGGSLGPDLNSPKSVTEYWKPEHLTAFIRNPSAYRNNTKMPTLTDLSDHDIALIVGYLSYMAGNTKQ